MFKIPRCLSLLFIKDRLVFSLATLIWESANSLEQIFLTFVHVTVVSAKNIAYRKLFKFVLFLINSCRAAVYCKK